MGQEITPVIVQDLADFKKTAKIWKEVDIYQDQLKELLEVRFPDAATRPSTLDGVKEVYVYYPGSGVLLKTVGDQELFELRTNRNQPLITGDEQTKLQSATVGVAGMSVGAGIALGAVYGGMSKQIKLADFDNLETANLNRIRDSLANIGQPKIDLVAQKIYELDPFADVQTFPKGIDANNIDQFFTEPAISLVVDEIDDFKMKVMLRVKAKENHIPLLMFTSLGDNILVDVERYDYPNQPEIFNGAIGDVADEILASKNITEADIKRYAVQTVGINYVPTRALESLPLIGHSLVGRPQLYSTIAVDGGLSTYLIRQIILGAKINSGRYFIKFADLVNAENQDFADTEKRNAILQKLMGPKK